MIDRLKITQAQLEKMVRDKAYSEHQLWERDRRELDWKNARQSLRRERGWDNFSTEDVRRLAHQNWLERKDRDAEIDWKTAEKIVLKQYQLATGNISPSR